MEEMLLMTYEYKYYLPSTALESVDIIKDLGVVFDSELSFVSHCKEKINRAVALIGLNTIRFFAAQLSSPASDSGYFVISL